MTEPTAARQVACLFIKDMRVARRFLLLVAPLYLIYAATFFSLTSIYLLVNMLHAFFLAIGVAIIDDYFKAHTFLCSLPMSRRTLAIGRYVSSLVILALGMFVCFAYGLLLNTVLETEYGNFDLSLVRGVIVPFLGCASVLLCLFFPLYYRLGWAKASGVLFGAVAITVILLTAISYGLYLVGIDSAWSWLESTRGDPLPELIIALATVRDALGSGLFYSLICVLFAALVWSSLSISIRCLRTRDF